jgi:hypothetical protein
MHARRTCRPCPRCPAVRVAPACAASPPFPLARVGELLYKAATAPPATRRTPSCRPCRPPAPLAQPRRAPTSGRPQAKLDSPLPPLAPTEAAQPTHSRAMTERAPALAVRRPVPTGAAEAARRSRPAPVRPTESSPWWAMRPPPPSPHQPRPPPRRNPARPPAINPQGPNCGLPNLSRETFVNQGAVCESGKLVRGPSHKSWSQVVKLPLLILVNCVENRRKIRKMQTQFCCLCGEKSHNFCYSCLS